MVNGPKMNSMEEKFISVVIPNFNKASTIGKCLEAAFASKYGKFEVIVVDDNSNDGSIELIKKYPCRLISLKERSGASKARNTGAMNAKGDVIFFTDSDCLLQQETLGIINRAMSSAGPKTVVGGTYTKIPYDKGFFNMFQSVFVNYSETKNAGDPDYIAAHAMAIYTETFRKHRGFPEVFMPIIEDVEYSHMLKRSGCRLVMEPDIQVRHIFGFSFFSSLVNAYRKSSYWNMYSLVNKDVFRDSGSASIELKTNVASLVLLFIFMTAWAVIGQSAFMYLSIAVFCLNITVNFRFLKMFFETKGGMFGVMASLYYIFCYPVPIGLATVTALMKYFFRKKDIIVPGFDRGRP